MTSPTPTIAALVDAARALVCEADVRGHLRKELSRALDRYDAEVSESEGGWRHKKRGTTYRAIGYAEVQTDEPISEGDVLMVYRADHDGKLWARPELEFHDGRFEEIVAPSPEKSEPK